MEEGKALGLCGYELKRQVSQEELFVMRWDFSPFLSWGFLFPEMKADGVLHLLSGSSLLVFGKEERKFPWKGSWTS